MADEDDNLGRRFERIVDGTAMGKWARMNFAVSASLGKERQVRIIGTWSEKKLTSFPLHRHLPFVSTLARVYSFLARCSSRRSLFATRFRFYPSRVSTLSGAGRSLRRTCVQAHPPGRTSGPKQRNSTNM